MHHYFREEGVCVWWDRDGGRKRERKGENKNCLRGTVPSHMLVAQPVTNPIMEKGV